MDLEFIKNQLAPCGLHCGKCFAFKHGDIARHSRALKNNLGAFSVYAKRFVNFCFQCNDFPCDDTGFDEHLYKHSVDINMQMKKNGIKKYYMEIKDKARY